MKNAKMSEKTKVKSEKGKPEPLEKGTMVFRNETTGEKITIRIELLDEERVAVEAEFEPTLEANKGHYKGVTAICALHVLNYLKD